MKVSLDLRVGQSLVLTAQLQQAIRLLTLSTLELKQEIEQQLEQNPLLELDDGLLDDTTDTPEHAHDTTTDLDEVPYVKDVHDKMQSDHVQQDLEVDVDWTDMYTDHHNNYGEEEENDFTTYTASQQNLQDRLMFQLETSLFSPRDRLIALFVIDAIDDDGFLIASTHEIIQALELQTLGHLSDESMDVEDASFEADEIEMVIHRIQQFEPFGVGCRNLQEYLHLQLKAQPASTERDRAFTLLQHADLLIQRDKPKLLKATGFNEATLTETLRFLKHFQRVPAHAFQQKQDDYQVPDVVVSKKDNKWWVRLNPDTLPKLRVNNYYAKMIQSQKGEAKQYLKAHQQNAKQFIKSIDERQNTLLRVAEVIVNTQKDYLEYGAEAMKPLILKEVADQLNLHESTISRITTQKFILTPHGLYELKYFFSSHVSTSSGGECSSTAICAMIKKIIQEENPKKPLSDQAIADMLIAQGIEIARRTVAKYRESIHIPSSSERKSLI